MQLTCVCRMPWGTTRLRAKAASPRAEGRGFCYRGFFRIVGHIMSNAPPHLSRTVVEGAGPVLHSPAAAAARGVVLFLAGLGSTKEKLAHSKRTQIFEEHGYACVLADHYNEGERRDSTSEPLSNRAGWSNSQKSTFWPAIVRTAQTVPRLVDFAMATYSSSDGAATPLPVYAYGSSMGGDIFLVSLQLERRLRAVVCERSTPDWLRPESTANVLGESDEGDALYREHAPCVHLERYVGHPTAVLFVLGLSDRHVPRASAEAFVRLLRRRGTDHIGSVALPSGGWEGHILRDAADATARALAFFGGAPRGSTATGPPLAAVSAAVSLAADTGASAATSTAAGSRPRGSRESCEPHAPMAADPAQAPGQSDPRRPGPSTAAEPNPHCQLHCQLIAGKLDDLRTLPLLAPQIDCLVNSANNHLLTPGVSGIAGAVRDLGGPSVQVAISR